MEKMTCMLDVVLEVDGTEFPCCRQVLMEHSPYFQAMFSNNFAEKNKRKIEIKDVDPVAMDVLLQSIEHGSSVLDSKTYEDLLSVLQAASMLQFSSLQIACVDIVTRKWLTPATSLTIMARANALSLTGLYHKARILALWEFSTVKQTPTFFELTLSELQDYLQDDGLNTVNGGEFEVFEAVLSWLQEVNMCGDNKDMFYLHAFQCIRFSDISISDLRTILLDHFVSNNQWIYKILHQMCDIKSGKIQSSEIPKSDKGTLELPSPLPTSDSGGSKRKAVVAEQCCCIPPADNSSISEYELRSEQNFPTIISDAILLLNAPLRKMPILPCVVGHCFEPPSPYIISFKDNKPIPLLPLTKAQQGPTEPNGYRVVNKGLDLFLLGGEFFWGHSNWNKSVWRYNLLEKMWTFETSLDQPCRHQSVCVLGDEIFVIGGFGKHRVITDSVRKYNIMSKEWVSCAPLPHPVYSAACCVYKGSIYVFGPQVWSYQPERNMWVTMSSHSNSGFNSAMPVGDAIYLTGMYSNDLVRFDGNLPDMPLTTVGSFQKTCTNSCLVHDEIYLFGTDFDTNMSVEKYNIKNNTFHVLWSGAKTEKDSIYFSQSSSIGCFAMVDYKF